MNDLELAEEIERRWNRWNGEDDREADLRQFLFTNARQIIAALRRGAERPPSGEMVMVPRPTGLLKHFHVTNQAYVKADAELTQAQTRIAELEKLLQRVRPFIDGRFDNNFLAQDEVRPDIVKAIDAALKDRA